MSSRWTLLSWVRSALGFTSSLRRRRRLERWFDDGEARLPPVGSRNGSSLGQATRGLRASGRSLPIKDSLIAATALVHGLTVVTRNTSDFKVSGARVLDPFA